MFSKTALVLSTAAGAGMGGAMKEIAVSLRFWGVAKIFKYGIAVQASDGVSDKKKAKIAKDMKKLSRRVCGKVGHAHPGLITKLLFFAFRVFHRRWGFCAYDVAHWEQKGWLKNKRPWK